MARAQLVRLFHGDEHPDGPGLQGARDRSTDQPRVAGAGKYIQKGNCSGLPIRRANSRRPDRSRCTPTFLPTLPQAGRQMLLGRWSVRRHQRFCPWHQSNGPARILGRRRHGDRRGGGRGEAAPAHLVLRRRELRPGQRHQPPLYQEPVITTATTACCRSAAERLADLAAGDAVLDPEAANALVRMGERQPVGRLGVAVAGGIEIDPQSLGLRPVDPALYCLGSSGCDPPCARPFRRTSSAGSRDACRARATTPVVVGPQFLGRAGLAGVVAGNRQAAAHFHVQVLEARVVIALPAVQRDGNLGQLLQARSVSTPIAAYRSLASAYVGSIAFV